MFRTLYLSKKTKQKAAVSADIVKNNSKGFYITHTWHINKLRFTHNQCIMFIFFNLKFVINIHLKKDEKIKLKITLHKIKILCKVILM